MEGIAFWTDLPTIIVIYQRLNISYFITNIEPFHLSYLSLLTDHAAQIVKYITTYESY